MTFVHFIGIDVSKNWFDVAVHGTQERAHRFDNTSAGTALFLKTFQTRLEQGFVVLEATGGYEMQLLQALIGAGICVHRAAPWQAHAFVRSLGNKAKTDGLDAQALARMAAERHASLRPFKLASKEQKKLEELTMRRADFIGVQMAEKHRAGHPRYLNAAPAIRRSLTKSLAFLERQIKTLEEEITNLIEASCELSARIAAMTTLTGVGARTALTLQAFLPELGTLTRRQAASLSGLAPHARDSGVSHKHRSIFGGRSAVKRVLFTAALSARTHDPILRAFFDKLVANGKPKMVAIIAIMRKLIVRLNAILRQQPLHNHGR
jgi:transposase